MKTDNIQDMNFIGIGKIMFTTSGETWNIPNLHFMVDHSYPDHYEATCLEFGLVSSGASHLEATSNLVSQINFYIDSVMTKGGGFAELLDVAKNGFMSDYWSMYRYFEFSLAEKGKDLSHDFDQYVAQERAATVADTLIEEYKKLKIYSGVSVAYVDLERAA